MDVISIIGGQPEAADCGERVRYDKSILPQFVLEQPSRGGKGTLETKNDIMDCPSACTVVLLRFCMADDEESPDRWRPSSTSQFPYRAIIGIQSRSERLAPRMVR
ncbi:MAG: hypothetical protein COA80_07380 [Leeuwenhoekiella sp.]|nr:MAG: hypothetical protein COA80_07380 [Leeuwenhoekiella sp.]